MIIIKEPQIIKKHKKVRLSADIDINNSIKTLWVEVDDKYAKYLVKDRCDAFLIALLPIAMRYKKDIICNSTVSEELLHNLRTLLIPTLSKNGEGFYKTRISADVNNKVIQNADAVGTGLAMGVDSMHAVCKYLEPEYPSMKLTHVCLTDFPTEYSEDTHPQETFTDNPKIIKSIELSKELELKHVFITSNLLSEFDVNYKLDHMYCHLFPIFALQKLFKYYLYGSTGLDYRHFSVRNSDKRDCSDFGLLLSSVLSISNIKIYIDGGEQNHLEKIEELLHFAPAQRYLYSCVVNNDKNCNKCYKCMRTMLALDALDRIDYFSQVFDTDYYKKNKRTYLTYLEKCHENNDPMLEPVYKLFKKKEQLTSSLPIKIDKGITLPEKVNTSAMILKNITNGNVILSKQTKEFLPAVAVTKILLAVMALKSGKNELVVDLPDGTIEGISRASIYDLINIMMITQNNKVTDVIANTVFTSTTNCVDEMNKLLKEIKAFSTHVTNPSGLGSENYTTVEDVVKIMEYALKNHHFCKIFRSAKYSFYVSEKEITISTLNNILKPKSQFYIPECIGAKYGLQGVFANHIAIFEKDKNLYLLILLGIKDDKKELLRFREVKNIISCIL